MQERFRIRPGLLVLGSFVAGAMALQLLGGVLREETAEAAAPPRALAQLDLVVSVPREVCPDGSLCSGKASTLEALRGLKSFRIDSFFDVEYVRVYRNIGSSGQDGVRRGARFASDSFFDITYFGDPDFDLFGDPDFDLFGDPDFDVLRVSAKGTLTDPSNPAVVLDELNQVLRDRHELRGHVTLIK